VWLERLTANAEVASVQGSIPSSSDTVESEVRQMKQCSIKYCTFILFQSPFCINILFLVERPFNSCLFFTRRISFPRGSAPLPPHPHPIIPKLCGRNNRGWRGGRGWGRGEVSCVLSITVHTHCVVKYISSNLGGEWDLAVLQIPVIKSIGSSKCSISTHPKWYTRYT
jgi:hypothetical protein